MADTNLEQTLERFDADLIRQRIRKVHPTKAHPELTETVYQGLAALCDVDIFDSTKLKFLISKYGYVGTMYTDMIKIGVKEIVEKNGGFWYGTIGDAGRYYCGDLESAVRCTWEVMAWFDRVMTEDVKDFLVAWEMLKERARNSDKPIKISDNDVQEMVSELRKIKDLWYESVPKKYRALKDSYERLYATIDSEVAQVHGERRGRIPTKAAITYGITKIGVAKEMDPETKEVDRTIKVEDETIYLMPRLTDKMGPLGGKKDIILIASYKPIPKLLPEFMKFGEEKEITVANTKFYLYETWGVDNFKHPTFDGRLPQGSPLLEKETMYASEVLRARDILNELQNKYRDRSLQFLDVTSDEREGTDRYKSGRSLMVSLVALGVIDEVVKLYDEYKRLKANAVDEQSSQHRELSLGYFFDVEKDATFTNFVETLKKERENILLVALTYSNGGSLLRPTSDTTAKYPTRKLKPEDYLATRVSERDAAFSATNKYDELVKRNVPKYLSVQDQKISEIRSTHGYELTLTTLILRMSTRYIHHRSYRAWKLPVATAEDAMYAIRNELSGIISPNGSGYTDNYFQLIDHAFTRALGIEGKVPFKKE